ncbi:hypothetical protein XANMN_23935 [Xanthomonas phaseoli pv. manihotis str. CIO151]|nr:hypothetical protein XANMN_23935 [Xanthomonas phaseoli pv. manihotis str. CIO151]
MVGVLSIYRCQCAPWLIRCRKVRGADAACASVLELDHAIAVLAQVNDVEGLRRPEVQPVALQLSWVQAQRFEVDSDFRRLAVMRQMRIALRDVADRVDAIVIPVIGVAMGA